MRRTDEHSEEEEHIEKQRFFFVFLFFAGEGNQINQRGRNFSSQHNDARGVREGVRRHAKQSHLQRGGRVRSVDTNGHAAAGPRNAPHAAVHPRRGRNAAAARSRRPPAVRASPTDGARWRRRGRGGTSRAPRGEAPTRGCGSQPLRGCDSSSLHAPARRVTAGADEESRELRNLKNFASPRPIAPPARCTYRRSGRQSATLCDAAVDCSGQSSGSTRARPRRRVPARRSRTAAKTARCGR